MHRIVLRSALTVGAAGLIAATGAGIAAASPILAPNTQEEGSVTLSSQPTWESWTCGVVGAAEGAGPRVDIVQTGPTFDQSRGGFAGSSTVVAACVGSQLPYVSVTTGVSSADD